MAVWVPTPGSHSAFLSPLICLGEFPCSIALCFCPGQSSFRPCILQKHFEKHKTGLWWTAWHRIHCGIPQQWEAIAKHVFGSSVLLSLCLKAKINLKARLSNEAGFRYVDWQVANSSVRWLLALTGCSPWVRKAPAVLPDGGARESVASRHVWFLHRCWGRSGSWFSSEAWWQLEGRASHLCHSSINYASRDLACIAQLSQENRAPTQRKDEM